MKTGGFDHMHTVTSSQHMTRACYRLLIAALLIEFMWSVAIAPASYAASVPMRIAAFQPLANDRPVTGKAFSPAAATRALQGLSTQGWASLQPGDRVAKLTASDGAAANKFGYSVSSSGNIIVVGAYGAAVGGNNNQGAAYVFARDQGWPGRWHQVKKLTASDGAGGDYFGWSVSISGDTLVVGADFADSATGAAYVFARNHGGADNWGQVKKLTASDGDWNDYFGFSVSISEDTAVVGAQGAEIGGNSRQGAVYVFARDQGGADNWGQVKKLTAFDGAADNSFGGSVSISGDANTLVVGARGAAIGGNNSQGAAYVFERSQGGADNWGQVKKLTAPDGTVGDYFGTVSISGDAGVLIVGARYAKVGDNASQGAAYVFARNHGGPDNWGQVKKLAASDGASSDYFGATLSIAGDTLVVGAYGTDIGFNYHQGAAYLFVRNQGGADNWGEVEKLTASDGAKDDMFGYSVSLSGDAVVVGMPYDRIDANADQGSAYVYSRSGADCVGLCFIYLPLALRDYTLIG